MKQSTKRRLRAVPQFRTCTCVAHAITLDDMSMLQVRNLSRKTHDELKRRAARARMSLSDYVANQLDILVRVPSEEEFWEWGMSDWDDDPLLNTELDDGLGNRDSKVEYTEEERELGQFIVDIIRERRGPLE